MDIISFIVVFEGCMNYVPNCSMYFLSLCLRVGLYKCSQLLFFSWIGFCVSLNSLFENTILIVSIGKYIELSFNSYAKELKRNATFIVFK